MQAAIANSNIEISFTKMAAPLPSDQAMALFVDKTDRTAPSTWDLGNFPAGQENYPVGGVSWYEAAAYAEFVGKSLPTIHHWYQASSSDRFSASLQASKFSEKGPAPVGSYAGLGLYGTYDMAGNGMVFQFRWKPPLYFGRKFERAQIHVSGS
jgi:formylglycine-generating enzyme required for sulfatase activity